MNIKYVLTVFFLRFSQITNSYCDPLLGKNILKNKICKKVLDFKEKQKCNMGNRLILYLLKQGLY